MDPIAKLKNKRVVVTANGIRYRGVLKEITEEAITLKGLTGWASVPLDKVTSVVEEGAGEKKSLSDKKFVDQSYYDFGDEEGDPKKG